MLDKIRSHIPQKAINYLKHWPIALSALHYYWFPSKRIKIIGVTGTDGKTTTVNLIYHILKSASKPVAMISTVTAKIGNDEIDTGFHVTAPEPWLLQKLLKKIAEKKMEYLVLEATSHGLDQFRLLGIDFEIGVITNITHEHLDYHKTFENYLMAKTRLFDNSLKVVLNKDDRSYGFLSNRCQVKNKSCTTYALKSEADYTPVKFKFKTNLPGEYNQYNCLAAISVCSLLGIPDDQVKKAIETFKGVEGRTEEIDKGQDFRVIVDFAHTPNALEQVLKAISMQKKNNSKLIVVFGAAGLRDKEKRPMMGKIAAKYADLIILTAEDPRTEDVNKICKEIAQGCSEENCEPKVLVNRKEAIEFAISSAKKDDIVIVCGKGHEKSMCFGKKEYPWSDKEEVVKILKLKK